MIQKSSKDQALTSKDNIIVNASKSFLGLIGYTESEVVGKTLEQLGNILRIDSQVQLQGIEEAQVIFIFNKKLQAIEGIISCEMADDGQEKVFSFTEVPLNTLREKFNFANQLATSRGDGVAIFSAPDLVLINSNQQYLDFIEPPYNKRINCIGKNIMTMLPETLYPIVNQVKDHVVSTGNAFYAEEIMLDVSYLGQSYWNLNVVPIVENKQITYLILYASNETEKVIPKKKLIQENKNLETIIQNMSDEIIIFDKDLNVELSSERIEKSLIRSNPALKNFSHMSNFEKDAYILDENNQLMSYDKWPFARVARGEKISGFFIKVITSMGIFYREVYGYPVYDENKKFNRGIMIFRDISNRIKKEASRLLKTQGEMLSKVVEALDFELIRCSYPDLKIISINEKGLTSLKERHNTAEPMASPIGANYFTIYPINKETKKKKLDVHLLEESGDVYINYTWAMINGEKRFFKTTNQPIVGVDNEIIEVIFITIDITDEVKAKNKVEETLEMQNQMFTVVAHELKTPLNVIFSAIQLIELDLKDQASEIDKEDMNKSVRMIKQNCYRFTKLINNIIDSSRMESEFYKLKYNNRNIVADVENIVDAIRPYVENIGLSIIFDTEIEEKIMGIDIDKIERILLNLISNAAKFSHKGDTIYVAIEDKGDTVLILVRDQGVGISKNHINTIFNKYKKVDNSLFRNTEGSGIGLSLVKTMVNLIKGEISVESELGRGSVFKVKLPVNILDKTDPGPSTPRSKTNIRQLDIEFSDIYTK